jgi:hypothetical protein
LELQEDRLWLIPNRSVITSVQKWLSCHTQEEIADAVGIDQAEISLFLTKIWENSRREDSHIFVNFDKNGRKILSGRFFHFRQFHQKKEGTETFFAFFP